MRNLIDNAIRYGGTANVQLMQESGMAVISIADKGPGLPDDQLEVVFEPFVRLKVPATAIRGASASVSQLPGQLFRHMVGRRSFGLPEGGWKLLFACRSEQRSQFVYR